MSVYKDALRNPVLVIVVGAAVAAAVLALAEGLRVAPAQEEVQRLKDQSETFQGTIASKDTQIEKLQADIEVKDQEIAQLTQQLRDAGSSVDSAQVETLQTQVTELQNANQVLQQTIQEKDAEIERLAAADGTTLLEPGEIVIGKEYPSGVPDIFVVVKSITILPDGKLRWNLGFWNRSTRDVPICLSDQSYVSVLSTGEQLNWVDSELPHNSVAPLFSNTRKDYSITFEAPNQNASEYQLSLRNSQNSCLGYTSYRVPVDSGT